MHRRIISLIANQLQQSARNSIHQLHDNWIIQFHSARLDHRGKRDFRRKFLVTEGGYSPVHGDHAEIQDAGRAAKHVEANPKVAHNCTEGPITRDLVEQRHRHYQKSDAQIANCEANQQIVARPSQLPNEEHGYADQNVPDHSPDNDAAEHQRD